MSIEHRLDIQCTAVVKDADGNVKSTSELPLKYEQVAAFRELCDGCYADSGCILGAECALYDDRVFRGEDVGE